jgi:CDGSH-type Zn-finger protein
VTPEVPYKKPTIECLPDGPYLVKGLKILTDSAGRTIPVKPVLRLCRCGGSGEKPFCDGTHAKNGFSSERLTDGALDRREDHQGREVTIHDNRGICSHAGFCTAGQPSVFTSDREPWIDPNGATAEGIIETIRKCPSGALSYSVDGVEHRDQRRDPEIVVAKDGSYCVRGGIELKDELLGDGASKEHYALCRCGASKNKPMCDGTHWYLEFGDQTP